MILGRIIGNVVSTSKDVNLEGLKLLVVQHVKMDMTDLNAYTVAADGIGAGEGELVLVVTGSSARLGTNVKNKPLDASILAIVDQVEIEGVVVFNKETSEIGR
ncbi:EutN/CcmL family microcompartment protein [soil metagenome]